MGNDRYSIDLDTYVLNSSLCFMTVSVLHVSVISSPFALRMGEHSTKVITLLNYLFKFISIVL